MKDPSFLFPNAESSENDTPRLEIPPSLKQEVCQTLVLGPRRPLFVVGAGISVDQGLPTMKQVFNFLHRELSKEDAPKSEVIVSTVQKLAAELATGQGFRPMAARLFGEVQDSRHPFLQRCWQDFCLAF